MVLLFKKAASALITCKQISYFLNDLRSCNSETNVDSKKTRWATYICNKSRLNLTHAYEKDLKRFKTANQKQETSKLTNINCYFADKPENFCRMNEHAKRILTKSYVRSPDDMKILRSAFMRLTHLEDLNKLNTDKFDKFLGCCWLSEYEAMRVIVKQYQKAKYFYMVVSGTLLCTYKPNENLPSRNICFIEKGLYIFLVPKNDQVESSCSQLLIEFHIKNSTHVQLLVISDESFHTIFNRNIRPPKSIDQAVALSFTGDTAALGKQIEFLQKLALFKSWPVNLLLTESNALQFRVYKRNQIIEKSANSSKYICVVMSGRASVWTHFTKNTSMSRRVESSNELSLFDSSGLASSELLEKHHIQFARDHSGLAYVGSGGSEMLSELEAKLRLKEKLDYLSQLRCDGSAKTKKNSCHERVELFHEYFPSQQQKKRVNWAPISTIYYYCFNEDENKEAMLLLPSINLKPPHKQQNRQKNKQRLIVKNQAGNEEKTKSVLMQQLYRGEQYGLHTLLFNSQPELELLSDGCECILISKEAFIRNSSFEFLRRLHETLLPFPAVKEIEASYEKHFRERKVKENYFTDKTTLLPRLIRGF